MAGETLSAFMFPGQALLPKEIVPCYNILNEVDPHLVHQIIGLTQDAINKFHGTSEYNILASLEDEESPDYKRTSFVQPIIYALSVITGKIINAKSAEKIDPDIVAGHSLGEYAALTRAGVITSFEAGSEIVTQRGQFMEEDCERTSSILISVKGLTEQQVDGFLKQGQERIAQIALINAPTRIVVGCAKEAGSEVEQLAKNAGAQEVSELRVAGAFHTSYMQKAANKLGLVLTGGYEFANSEIPVISNYEGKPYTSGLGLKHQLIAGMVCPVRWAKTIATMQSLGVKDFCEVGPGTSLTALNRINGIPKEQAINVLGWLGSRA